MPSITDVTFSLNVSGASTFRMTGTQLQDRAVVKIKDGTTLKYLGVLSVPFGIDTFGTAVVHPFHADPASDTPQNLTMTFENPDGTVSGGFPITIIRVTPSTSIETIVGLFVSLLSALQDDKKKKP
jgi:hypothetical protein